MTVSSIQKIVYQYRHTQEHTLRSFAEVLSSDNGDQISYQAIQNWEKGVHAPSFRFLLGVAHRYSDWRRDFAFDCLAAMHPGMYQPSGEIGEQILRNNNSGSGS